MPADGYETFEPLSADPDATLVLRAAHSRPASVYTANARQGVRRPEQIVRHCVAVTV